jgi:hypothetical protein
VLEIPPVGLPKLPFGFKSSKTLRRIKNDMPMDENDKNPKDDSKLGFVGFVVVVLVFTVMFFVHILSLKFIYHEQINYKNVLIESLCWAIAVFLFGYFQLRRGK